MSRVDGSGVRSFDRATWTIVVCSNSAGRICNTAIQSIVGAGRATLHTTIELRHRLITDTVVPILGQGSASPMRLCGEGGADAEYDGERQNGCFDFFHTKLFLFCLVIDIVWKRFLD